MTQTPELPNDRLDRLEAALGRFAELTIQNIQRHDDNIDVLVANIQQLTETVTAVTNRVDLLAIAVDRSTQNIDNLTVQAAQDRQQAAIDRQEFRGQMELRQREIQQIWEYLRDRNGGSAPPQ